MFGVPIDDVWSSSSLLSQTVMAKPQNNVQSDIMAGGNAWPPRWMQEQQQQQQQKQLPAPPQQQYQPHYEQQRIPLSEMREYYSQDNYPPQQPAPQQAPPVVPDLARYEGQINYLKNVINDLQRAIVDSQARQQECAAAKTSSKKKTTWSHILFISIIVLLVLILIVVFNVSHKVNQLAQTPLALRGTITA